MNKRIKEKKQVQQAKQYQLELGFETEKTAAQLQNAQMILAEASDNCQRTNEYANDIKQALDAYKDCVFNSIEKNGIRQLRAQDLDRIHDEQQRIMIDLQYVINKQNGTYQQQKNLAIILKRKEEALARIELEQKKAARWILASGVILLVLIVENILLVI